MPTRMQIRNFSVYWAATFSAWAIFAIVYIPIKIADLYWYIVRRRYPFEIYCTRCNTPLLLIARRLGPGEKIEADQCIRPDGSRVLLGEKIPCRCTSGSVTLTQRDRS